MEWQRAEYAPQDVRVWTKIDDERGERNVQIMRRKGNLWWTDDGMYVYYTPTHFKRI